MAEWVSGVATAVLLLLMVSFYASWRASRLDRLHTRVETARAALEAALSRRTAVVLELSAAPGTEPASAVLLADAAGAAHRAGDAGRELAESDLSRTLRAVAAQSDPPPEAAREVEAAAKRVLLARRFYNDAVAQTRDARAGRLVRLLRLAGRAPLPDFFEMDDGPPGTAQSFGAG